VDRLSGKTVLLTGGARGQGAAEAELFAAEGAQVVVGDILDDEGKQLADRLGDAVHYQHLDVSDEQDWDDFFAFARRVTGGGLHGLVNNAGITPGSAPLADTTLASFRRVTEVNQIGTFLGLRGAARHLADGGSVVNTSSALGIVGFPTLSPYVASKFAIRGLTKTAALELAGRRIRVNSVHPSIVETPLIADWDEARRDLFLARTPLGRFAEPTEIAELCTYLLSDASAMCTGSEFVIDGGWSAA